jgi:hypothetical protein
LDFPGFLTGFVHGRGAEQARQAIEIQRSFLRIADLGKGRVQSLKARMQQGFKRDQRSDGERAVAWRSDHDRNQHHGVMKNDLWVATSAPESRR